MLHYVILTGGQYWHGAIVLKPMINLGCRLTCVAREFLPFDDEPVRNPLAPTYWRVSDKPRMINRTPAAWFYCFPSKLATTPTELSIGSWRHEAGETLTWQPERPQASGTGILTLSWPRYCRMIVIKFAAALPDHLHRRDWQRHNGLTSRRYLKVDLTHKPCWFS